MKKISLIAAVILLAACQKEQPVDYALFSGAVKGDAPKVVRISGPDFKQEIEVNADGTFADTLKIDKSGFYTYSIGRERSALYLDKGFDVKLSIDPKEFDESIAYEGNGAAENNFLAKKYLLDEEMKGDYKDFYSLDADSYKKKASEVKDASNQLLEGSGASEAFKAIEKKNIHYSYLAALNDYEPAHKYYTKTQELTLPDGFLSEMDGLDFDNAEDFENSSSYKGIVSGNFYRTSSAKAAKDSLPYHEVALEYLKGLKSQNIKNSLVQSLAYEVSPSNEKAEELYNSVIAISTDEEFKKGLSEKFEKIKNLVKGKPSPKFVNYENHKGGTMSLEDLKGKFVYVDVWATWCGPCKREIPFLKEVEKKYHDKNIEFVSISIDRKNDHEAWKKMVDEKELGGIQLFADSDWQSKFVTDYAIEGIPRFILIGPDGMIVNADAPRPSSPNLVALFDELKI